MNSWTLSTVTWQALNTAFKLPVYYKQGQQKKQGKKKEKCVLLHKHVHNYFHNFTACKHGIKKEEEKKKTALTDCKIS